MSDMIRRDFIALLPRLPAVLQGTAPAPLRLQGFNHVSLTVSDLQRSPSTSIRGCSVSLFRAGKDRRLPRCKSVRVLNESVERRSHATDRSRVMNSGRNAADRPLGIHHF